MRKEPRMPDPNDETAELIATVEEIRATKYPDLDPELVNAVLEVQHQFAEDRAEARKRTEQLINRWASAQPAPEAAH